jgi:hypothetical protein
LYEWILIRNKTMENTSENKAFEKVKDQIGFCGIWCGSCVVGNGTLQELTKRYETLLKAYDLEKWAPKDFDYKEFAKGLASIQGIPLCPGCLKGGGRDGCEMRTCASGRGLEECIACQEFDSCDHAEILEKMRSGARNAGLFVKARNEKGQAPIEEWTVKIKSQWPCCLLSKDNGSSKKGNG